MDDQFFLAAFPDAAAAEALRELALRLQRERGREPQRPREAFHVALHPVAFGPSLPRPALEAIGRAMAGPQAQPVFDVAFDRVLSHGGAGAKPIVLAGRDDGVASLVAFQRDLATHLQPVVGATLMQAVEQMLPGSERDAATRALRAASRFQPHIVLYHDDTGLPESAVPPITWPVSAIELLQRRAGKPQLVSWARWTLALPVAAAAPTTAQFSDTDHAWMQRALALAAQAGDQDDEVPVGAVLVDADGRLVAEASNLNAAAHDPSAHAEMLALRRGGEALASKRLSGCTLYVTLEPCPMCAAALVHARIDRLVYAAASPKTGAAGTVFDLLADPRHNHAVRVDAGLLADTASAQLSDWFRRRRARET